MNRLYISLKLDLFSHVIFFSMSVFINVIFLAVYSFQRFAFLCNLWSFIFIKYMYIAKLLELTFWNINFHQKAYTPNKIRLNYFTLTFSRFLFVDFNVIKYEINKLGFFFFYKFQMMVRHGRVECLSHKLCRTYLTMKWSVFLFCGVSKVKTHIATSFFWCQFNHMSYYKSID